MEHRNLQTLFALFLAFSFLSCNAQEKKSNTSKTHIGGHCEGCEALLEYGDKNLKSVDTLPGFETNNPKLKVYGTVYKKDGKTPAENVIVYIYHTNRKGIYETKGNETGWGKRHGFIRGWTKTDKDGKYAFYTFRPASYPNTTIPQHIHVTIKEPNKNPYFIDDFHFVDDPNLTSSIKNNRQNRGGSGIMTAKMQDGLPTVKRDIVLGLNIPDYY